MPWGERLALFQAHDALPSACGLGALDRELYQGQLDDLVAGECPLTGTVMIESVGMPLLSGIDEAAERAAWDI